MKPEAVGGKRGSTKLRVAEVHEVMDGNRRVKRRTGGGREAGSWRLAGAGLAPFQHPSAAAVLFYPRIHAEGENAGVKTESPMESLLKFVLRLFFGRHFEEF